MKKSNLKYFIITTVAVLGMVAISVYSCEKQEFVPNTTEGVSNDPTGYITEPGAICGEMIEKKIVKVDGRAVGQALVYNDTKYFYVIMTANKGYLFSNTYMHVGSSVKEIPTDGNGNPILENYEYTIDSKPSSTFRKFRIPLKEITGNNFVSVAIDAESNTTKPVKPYKVWIEGQLMGNKNLGQMFIYAKQICRTEDAQNNYEVE